MLAGPGGHKGRRSSPAVRGNGTFDPALGCGPERMVAVEVSDVSNQVSSLPVEVLLAGLVRDWVRGALPGEEDAAERAVALAERAYAGGASVSEACREARAFIGSWSRHPSHESMRPHLQHIRAS